MKINDSNVTIMVKDMDKSIAFYLSIGFKLKQRWGNHYAMLKAKNIIIGLHPADKKIKSSEQISLGFMIDDIKDAKKLLTKNKIKFEFADGKSGIYTHFQDPDGTYLYFTQPKWS